MFLLHMVAVRLLDWLDSVIFFVDDCRKVPAYPRPVIRG